MNTFYISNEQDLQQAWGLLADFVIDRIPSGCLCLEGNLGAGKTTFVQVLAQKMGFSGVVLSPTYSLAAHYPSINLVHLDLYRINDRREILGLGLEDHSESLIVIEWGEQFKEMFEDLKAIIRISSEPDGTERKVIVEFL